MHRGKYHVYQGRFDSVFNDRLLEQYEHAETLPGIRKTHYFNGRYENIYLNEEQVPALAELKAEARLNAEQILGQPIRKMGCWFNAMGPGTETTLHSHDDDDELLSGVYYVCVPKNSGRLIIQRDGQTVRHDPQEGQWVFFSPLTPHAVELNRSESLRLSIAFNFC